jgi:hypothetical protein
MKTIILAAFAVTLVALFANRFDRPVNASVQASPASQASAVAPSAPPTIYLPERTITAEVPRVAPTARPRPVSKPAHAETDAEHVARLMTATPEMVSCAGCTPRKPFETYTGKVSRLSPELY